MAYTTKYSYPLLDFLTPYPAEEEVVPLNLNSNLHTSQTEEKLKIQKKTKRSSEFVLSQAIETVTHFLNFLFFQREKDSYSKEEINPVDSLRHVCNIDGTLNFY
jgi:hypothetical protein